PAIVIANGDATAGASLNVTGKLSQSRRHHQESKSAGKEVSSVSPRTLTGAAEWNVDRLILLACALFTIAYLCTEAFNKRLLPPVATDALVYHLPMAVQWMQTHRLGMYPTWYWNPAASYSPQTGSI